jgi:N-acetylmuramoyl-L-alanine amidase
MNVNEFIEKIAVYVKKYAPRYGIKVYSPIIAQAILESAKGTSELAVNANNFHGLKYRPRRCPTSKGYYVKVGSEQNADGSYSSSVMKWCKFDDMENGVIGYFDFINISNYANLKGVTDPRKYLENIKADGYATSLKYVENLMNVIETYDLTKYDEEVIDMSKKVFLSAGHGGSDPGAVKYGLKEKEINLQTLLSCKAELERHGVQVVASRVKDENDPVSQEVKEEKASGADLAVSFHANAGGGDGFEAFYHTSNANGKKLAQLGEKYVKALGQNSRGIKSGNHLYFIKNTKATAVLFESFFVDNDLDNNIGDTIAEQKLFGVAYAKAILEYLGIKYKVQTEEKPAETKKLYLVQVGAFTEKAKAEKLQKELKAKGYEAIIV